MSEVPRVPPPYDRGGVRKETGSVDEEKFKKLMKVEEVEKSETSEQRKRKRRGEETEEETVEKAGGGKPTSRTKKVKAIDEGAPLTRKKVAPRAIPTTPAAPPTAKQAPMAGFKADEIEAYAWEEEAAESTAPRPYTREATTHAEKAEVSGPEITGEAPKKTLGAGQPPVPQEPFAAVEPVLEAQTQEEAPPGLAEKGEEWPQTTSFRPSAAFRSHDEPPTIEREREIERRPAIERPSGPEAREREEERRKAPIEKAEEKKKRKAPAEEEAVKKKAPAAGMPKEIKKGKEAEKSFAEMMEGEEEEKPLTAAAKAEFPKAPPKPTPGMAPEKEALIEGKKAPPVVPGEVPPKAEVKPPVPSIVPPVQAPKEAQEKEAAAAAEKGILAPEETFPSLKKTAPTTISPEKAEKEQKERVEGVVVPMAAPSEGGAGTGGEGEAKREGREAREEEIAALAARVPGEVAPFAPHIEAPAPTAPSPYAQMSPQVLALFERMVGVMTIIQTTGVTETVMTLNARQFASSVLYGSQIVIREFSTAPTAFNVEFIGSPEALALVQQNIPGLMGAVQQGNFNFTINRFDVKLATGEKPIFTRKEAVGEKGEKEEKQEKEDNRDTP